MLWQFVPGVDYPVTEKEFPDICSTELLWYLEGMASGVVVAEFEKAVGPILIETMDIFIHLTQIKYFPPFFQRTGSQSQPSMRLVVTSQIIAPFLHLLERVNHGFHTGDPYSRIGRIMPLKRRSTLSKFRPEKHRLIRPMRWLAFLVILVICAEGFKVSEMMTPRSFCSGSVAKGMPSKVYM